MEMGAIGALSLCVETPRAVFGVPLISLRKSGQMRQGLPLALTHMVEFVEKHGLSKIGLFIVGGSVQRCRDLKKGFDDGGFPERDSRDVDTWASLLKHFLKEIPGGLIRSHTRHNCCRCSGVPFSPTMFKEQGQCNALIKHLLDNLIHLLPDMYLHASASNTAVSLLLYYSLML
ncbi:protein FAM13B-like [Puntigrus tetrazona]|uniref:protein FAM13B-like n=1 Tax=Puntigrus tetrazona TaxID=1606681 RepID=UPI001C897050|nr:protein FAM13B-like [Puntigrus tetrazona]